ncbi:16S rRNA (cytidine(1402)-2'-O)-methyltransferase [Candidatus Azambacteria bacterium]|nr:16S rRNA (cytidine(1402)-2'-O)-methyltransferase [Candidatus Azambacteria bacterium]
MPSFYIVSTPIGNLSDITLRAVETLKQVDLILCEDTRVAKKLLAAYDIKKPVESYHKHSRSGKIDYILNLLKEGGNLALISDAGTPAVSDPGSFLVGKIVKNFGDEVKIIPIPGASAVLAALSVSGFESDKFKFFGFPPHKKGRQTFFKEVASEESTIVFYESKHRIQKALKELAEAIGERRVVLCRELTKIFETTYRGTAKEVLENLEKDKILGEFVVVIDRKK